MTGQKGVNVLIDLKPPMAPEQGPEPELNFEDAPGILLGDRLLDEIAY